MRFALTTHRQIIFEDNFRVYPGDAGILFKAFPEDRDFYHGMKFTATFDKDPERKVRIVYRSELVLVPDGLEILFEAMDART